jgi:hypothetical protein
MAPVIAILRFLKELVGIDDSMLIKTTESFKFSAGADLVIAKPDSKDGFIYLGALRLKGTLKMEITNSPVWSGSWGVALGLEVPIPPTPLFAGGEITTKLKGQENLEQQVTILMKWGLSFPIDLFVFEITGKVYFGILVIVSTGATGALQIGMLIGISGTADVWIFKVTVKVEILAAIKRLPPSEDAGERVEAIGQTKFAAEISVCWFLTISISVTLEYRELHEI